MASLAHSGSSMPTHIRYALSRHSSIHSGSFFLAEMYRTVSSDSPLGANSCSMSEEKPHSYFLFAAASASAFLVAISATRTHAVRFEPPGIGFADPEDRLRRETVAGDGLLDFARSERRLGQAGQADPRQRSAHRAVDQVPMRLHAAAF